MSEIAVTRRSATGLQSAYIDWRAIFAGAALASALTFLFMSFVASLGLSSTSPWSGLSARGMMIWGAIFVVLVQVASFGAGGYVAGRLRMPVDGASQSEIEFRDGTHGVLVWAVGALIGAVLLAMAASAVTRAGGQVAGAVASGATSAATEALKVANPVESSIDVLFRPTGNARANDPANSEVSVRAEIARIMVASVQTGQLSPADKSYLAQIASTRTGLTANEAEARVDAAFAQLRQSAAVIEQQAKQAADKARRAAMITGFLTAASLLLSCAVAAVAAAAGGRHRDSNTPVRIFGTERLW